jgi:APA family basic amino acid/polyamine antiporter
MTDQSATPTLERSIGTRTATALVVGNMVGSGVFLLPAALASEAGPVSIFAWVFTGLGAMLLGLVFARLGRAIPRSGGPYAYAQRAFGDFVGFQTAWGYWIAVWAGNAAIAVAFAGYLSVYWPRAATGWVTALIAIGLVWIATATNIAGVREGGGVQVVTTILKFVPLLLIAVVGLFFVKTGNYHPFAIKHTGDRGINGAAALTLWAFIGLESATVAGGEVRNPERTLPRATIYGTLAATLLYLIATIAIFGMIPTHELAHSNSPFADAANVIFGGTWGGKAIAVVAMISTFGALNGWTLLQGRVPLAAAEDGLFPRRFARVHGRSGTPVFGLVVSSVLVTALLLLYLRSSLVNTFYNVILLATLTTLVPYAYSAAAELYLLFKERTLFSGRKLARDAVVSALAFAYSAWAIWGAGEKTIAWGFMLLLAGIPVYVWLKWRQASSPSTTAPPESLAAANGSSPQSRELVGAVDQA